ncbi:MAG: exo-alpha-sialidase [Proteobacteria bacterium]|nr:exo-alpha-sialidase [Pseudomonadota bacterium]
MHRSSFVFESSRPLFFLAALIALGPLSACKGGGGPDDGNDSGDSSDTGGGEVITSGDIQVDGADALTTDPESTDVQFCTVADQIYVAWIDNRSGTDNVWLNRSTDAGETWLDEPVNASQSDGEVTNPSLACYAGSAWLAWEDSRGSEFGNESVWTSRSTDGGATWGTPISIGLTTDFEHDANDPMIAARGSNVVVAWAANPGGGFDIYTTASHDGGETFGDPVAVESDNAGASYSARPQVVFMASDGVRVLWEDRRTGIMTIRGTRSSNAGDSYGSDNTVSDGTTDAFHVRLATASNQTYATWHQGAAGERLDVHAAWAADESSNFADSMRISAGDAGVDDDVRPRVTMNNGYGHVAWYTESLGGYHVSHASLLDGAVSVAAKTIDHAADTARADRPSIAQSGSAIAIGWEDDRDAIDDGNHDLYISTSLDHGESWDGDYRVSSMSRGLTAQTDLHLAANDTLFFAAWSDARAGNSNIYFTTFPVPETTGGAR